MQRAATGLAATTANSSMSTSAGSVGFGCAWLLARGNNGGDALFAASQLARRGVAVDIVATADTLHPSRPRAAGAEVPLCVKPAVRRGARRGGGNRRKRAAAGERGRDPGHGRRRTHHRCGSAQWTAAGHRRGSR